MLPQTRKCVFAVLILLGLGLLPAWSAEPEPVDPESWYSRMRTPWEPRGRGFIREWLILGDFPKAQLSGNGDNIFDYDLLSEHGGETNIQPKLRLAHSRPDGSAVTWFAHQATGDIIDLAALLERRPTDNAIAYAFTTVDREKAGPAILGIGSDDGIQVWVNGKLVHRHRVGRAVTIDDDRVPVEFVEGENTILLKIENGTGGWGFACRIIENTAQSVLPRKELNPVIESEPNADELVVQSDRAGVPGDQIEMAVVGAGGHIAAFQTVARGETASFATADWPDGAYEIRCTLALPFGKQRVRHLPWFKGNAAAAIERVLQAESDPDSGAEADLIIPMLGVLIRDRLGERTEDPDAADALAVHSALLEFEELELERTGQGSRIRPHGYVRLAYRDEVDGAPQFAQVFLPPNYDPAQKWPLVIYLHGYNPDNPEYVKWWAIDARHHDRAEDYGVIYLVPHGRGNTSYRGIGEADVLRCIRMAKERFSVDADRVLLTGESMGGGGTWHVGTRNPELFAAIAPVFGGWDYLVSMPDEDLHKLSPLERFQHERRSSFAQTEALLTTPVFVNHGDADHLVDVNNSRFAVRQLQRWRYDIRYGEQPGGGHFDSDHWPAIMRWLLEQKRVSNPRELRIRSAILEEAAAHWVRVECQAHPFRFMQVKAECTAPNTVRLDTENVLAVTLAPGGELADPDQPLTVVWNETDIRTVPLENGSATLDATNFVSAPLLKRPELAGPIRDVQTTPFAIVQGTISSNPLMRAFCEYHARNLVHGWEDWQKHTPRFFRDVDLPEADLAAYSLILVGGSEANAVTKILWNSLPVRLEANAIVLDGHTFEAPDAAIQMVYPHPLNPDRYLHLFAANSPDGMFHAADTPNHLDFYIVDGRAAAPDAEVHAEDLRVASGCFDHAWRVNDEFLFRGDPGIRAAGRTARPPKHVRADVPADRLYLSEVLESRAVQTFRQLRRDVNARGEPLKLGDTTYEHGLSVFPWSTAGSADWDLEGGNWQLLKGVIGLELNPSEDDTDKDVANTRVRFTVKGDGQELFRSEPFGIDTPPQDIEVPIGGFKTLTLVVHNEASWTRAVKSADWANLQLLKSP